MEFASELTKEIGEFVTQTTMADIPPDVSRIAKNAIIDCVGVTLPGAREEASRIIQRYAREMGPREQASVIGTTQKTSATLAALANGVAAHVLDLDDVNSLLIGHPSVVLMPTVMAAGEMSEAPGEQVLMGYILGFEVTVKLAGMLNPAHYEHGWHATSTFGALGAATAAAKILGLSQEQIQRALGLATSLAGGVRRNFGTMTKSFHAGNAARAGLESAVLSRMGFTGHHEILDHPMGFLDVFGTAAEGAWETVARTLGNPFELATSGIDFKRYPCCGGVVASVDAAIAIRQDLRFSLDQVESIECGQNTLGSQILVYPEPQTPLEGKFSLEYGVCRALIDGELGLEGFTDEKVSDPVLKELLGKTRAFVHPDLEKVRLSEEDRAQRFPSILTVKLRDGTVLTKRVDNARGRWDNPLTQEEIYDKYRQYAGPHLTPEQWSRSLEMMDGLESVPAISDLMAELVA